MNKAAFQLGRILLSSASLACLFLNQRNSCAAEPPTIESIIEGIAETEALMFDSESFTLRFRLVASKTVTKAKSAGNHLLSEWTIANLDDKWYAKRFFLGSDEADDTGESGRPLVQVVRGDMELEWRQAHGSAALNRVEGASINIYQGLSYFRGLSLDSPKYIIRSLGVEAQLPEIKKRKRKYVDHPFLPQHIINNKESYRVLPTPETIDGSSCWVVEWKGMDRFWVDPDRGFAVVNREHAWAPGTPLRYKTSNSDYREVKPGLWLPHLQIVDAYFDPDRFEKKLAGKIRFRDTYELLGVEFDSLNEEFFDVSLPAGTRVYDATRDFTYTVSNESSDPFSLPLEKGTELLAVHRKPQGWLIVANVLVIGTLLVLIVKKHWSHAKQ